MKTRTKQEEELLRGFRRLDRTKKLFMLAAAEAAEFALQREGWSEKARMLAHQNFCWAMEHLRG